jgi:hypothetical protein
MYSEELHRTQQEWAERALMASRSLLPHMTPVATYLGWNPREKRTISYLLSSTARVSESAFLLCAYGQLWDAEALVRSALEGSLKLAYLLQARETFTVRHTEYADQLFKIALLKDHRKAEALLKAVPDSDALRWRPIREMLLSQAEIAEFSTGTDKVTRRALEGRWGFTGLIGELSRSGDPYFTHLAGLAHMYSMASHVQHVDVIGASIAIERDQREPQIRDSIHLAHEARLLSDLLSFLFLRFLVGYRFVDADNMAQIAKIKSAIDEAERPFQHATGTWLRVQYPSEAETESAPIITS